MATDKRIWPTLLLVVAVAVAAVVWLAEPTVPVPLAAIAGGETASERTETAASRPADSSPPEWNKPRSAERREERHAMVQLQIRQRGVRSEAVLAAMRDVPRHWFVPESDRGSAYSDRPVGIGHGQTISQPYIVALMTEVLELDPDDKVLEIGTGSGYQAAVLNELTPHVFTVEIIQPLVERTAELLKAKGYHTIATKHADGYFGWPEHAPYDAIIVTCAAPSVPPPLIEQLKPGGRLCIPVGGSFWTQRLMLITKQADGSTRSKNLLPVAFVRMTGEIDRR